MIEVPNDNWVDENGCITYADEDEDGVCDDADGELSLIEDIYIPEEYSIAGVYPNPFNPRANIGYEVPDFSMVNLTIYNIQGGVVKELVNGQHSPGVYTLSFDASNYSSGVYILLMRSDNFSQTQKLMLIK